MISVETLMQVHFYVRKAAHVSEYAVLAALLYRALVNTILRGRVLLSAAIVLTRLRFLCDHGRISPIVCAIADGIGARCCDR